MLLTNKKEINTFENRFHKQNDSIQHERFIIMRGKYIYISNPKISNVILQIFKYGNMIQIFINKINLKKISYSLNTTEEKMVSMKGWK